MRRVEYSLVDTLVLKHICTHVVSYSFYYSSVIVYGEIHERKERTAASLPVPMLDGPWEKYTAVVIGSTVVWLVESLLTYTAVFNSLWCYGAMAVMVSEAERGRNYANSVVLTILHSFVHKQPHEEQHRFPLRKQIL
ncbi:hypothetical protein BC939DRAFT_437876 [Gamsiella multidivaricata]|uniref:uncharacterized protein n=1 Tax=Gamsiella multidivaricata TaxID=101098 RepID=UPI00221E66A1|nr:uncharacterized protein BC939DRAFT_437876 [Gamsiella multidivaricata]KAI7831190.1 hypothetical protein BC939DRAFT_437876 [Gamsiella multidivaricata]